MITTDTHTHTNFSTDSDAFAEQMIDTAIDKGLKIYTVTDHMDYDNHHYQVPSAITEGIKKEDFILDTPSYFDVLSSLKNEYQSKIDLRIGVEYGLQPHLNDVLSDYASKYAFDMIIGSVHEVNGVDPYYDEFLADKSALEAYHLYFRTEAELSKSFDAFDTFGHIDYGLRYHHDKLSNFKFSYSDFYDELDELLKSLITKGKGVELNTNTFTYFDKGHSPMIEILKRYRELGGEIVTVGSDAHKCENIAKHFDIAQDLLTSLNYKYIAAYKNRQPEFIKI